MIDLLYKASRLTACVFIEILQRLPTRPKKNNTPASCQAVCTKPINGNSNAYEMAAGITIFLLPKCVTSQPEKGSDMRSPTGKASNTAPRPASLRWRYCLISGIREAQLAKQTPAKKKKAP